jgi:hypothetical protein
MYKESVSFYLGSSIEALAYHKGSKSIMVCVDSLFIPLTYPSCRYNVIVKIAFAVSHVHRFNH